MASLNEILDEEDGSDDLGEEMADEGGDPLVSSLAASLGIDESKAQSVYDDICAIVRQEMAAGDSEEPPPAKGKASLKEILGDADED